jgi:hypothetical protein
MATPLEQCRRSCCRVDSYNLCTAKKMVLQWIISRPERAFFERFRHPLRGGPSGDPLRTFGMRKNGKNSTFFEVRFELRRVGLHDFPAHDARALQSGPLSAWIRNFPHPRRYLRYHAILSEKNIGTVLAEKQHYQSIQQSHCTVYLQLCLYLQNFSFLLL